MLLHLRLFLFFIAVASVRGADSGALDIPSSIVAIRHQTVPAVVQPMQHAVQCPSCFDYTVASAPSHFKTQRARGHDSDYSFDELTIPWQQCVHGVCQNITIAVAQRTPKPVAMRWISLDEQQKAHLLKHQRRPLFFLGAAALGVAVTALTEVRALKSAFYAFQEKILANLTQIQAQLNMLAENVYEIKDGLKRLSANNIISVANAQILTMRSNSRLSAAMLRMTHIPAYLAAATLSAARVMNLRVPVHFGGDLEAFVREGSNQVVLKKSLENSFYHYLGLVQSTKRLTDMLTTLGYLYNPCGHDPFLIADIQEALMPWGSVAYSAIVYAVFPKVDFNPSILVRTCSSIFGSNQNQHTPNTGCFDNPTSAQTERIRKTTLYQSGSAYAVVVPVDAHDSRDSLTSVYSITDYINVKGESAYEKECSSSRFPSAGVGSLVYLPLRGRVAVSQSGRQSELGAQCFDTDSFNAQFQGDSLCTPNFIAFSSGVRMDGPPTIGTTPFPEYHGEVDYLSGGTINFKTLAISEAMVDVMLLRSNITYFYQTSIGFARTPDFYDEWVTEDGRSVPEELINQYTSWGIATGYTNASTLQGLVSIPAAVYTLPPVGDTRCYSEACARNRLNYEWNGRSYGKALYPIVIADATEPIPCSATFDCSTVGPKARPGSTPTPCGDSQAVCCNAQGYVCFVKFSGTDSLGNMITVGPDGATGFNIKDYLNRTLPGVLPIWDFQERLENATKKLREEMNKTFPVTWTSAESDVGDFFDVVTDGLKAAAEAPLKVANEALDLVKKLNPLGFAADLFGWLLNLLVMLLLAAIAIGVCVCCFKVALDSGGSGGGGITRYFPVGNSDVNAS